MDIPIAPPLRLIVSHPAHPVSHDEGADMIASFLHSYTTRTGGTSVASGTAGKTDMQAAFGADGQDGTAGTDAVGGDHAALSGNTTAGGNTLIISQLTRLKQQLRAEA